MQGLELINYCDRHCRTERALFAGCHIKQMFALAGMPVPEIRDDAFYSMYEDMATLCKEARARMSQNGVL